MEIHRDFSDLLVCLTDAQVEFVLVGAYALASCTADFTAEDRVVQLGDPPVRVDLLTSISGVSWNEAIDSA